MGTKKSTRARRPASRKAVPIITHQPGKGLMVSTVSTWPESVGAKIICAKSIIQAASAAHDNLVGENYDIRWALDLAVALLEQASAKVDA